VVVTSLATVFRIAGSRGAAVVHDRLGEADRGVVTGDRWKADRRLRRLPWCWAHRRRDFPAMIDRGTAAKAIGEALLQHSDALFEWSHKVRDGTLSRASFQKDVGWLRAAVRDDLEAGLECGCARTAATCRDLLEPEPNLSTFLWHEGVEPTTNAAERAWRHAVIWRRSSGGTDSVHGSRFVERILSVVATCRLHGRNVLDYLHTCYQQALHNLATPSLLNRSSAYA
jgi:transposase